MTDTLPATPDATSPAAAPASVSGVDVSKLLNERFAVFRDALPLAIGIHKAVMKALPEIDGSKVKAALRRHVGSTRYLKAVANGDDRFDLEGQPAGKITEEQKKQAADSLRERFKKGADRRRAELQAQQEKERADAREKQRQEKLLQLANKFNSR